MIVLDYNSYLGFQDKELGRRFKILITFNNVLFAIFRRNWLLKTLNRDATAHLLGIKGLYSYLQEHAEVLKNQDLNKVISIIERVIEHNYQIQDSLSHSSSVKKMKRLASVTFIVDETLSITYDVLRLLKRYNKRIPIESQSEEAKAAVQTSEQTINKILSNEH